jgi:hypothetical protein
MTVRSLTWSADSQASFFFPICLPLVGGIDHMCVLKDLADRFRGQATSTARCPHILSFRQTRLWCRGLLKWAYFVGAKYRYHTGRKIGIIWVRMQST